MPLDRQQCDCCGDHKATCPECGSHAVVARDDPMKLSPDSIVDFGYGTKPDVREETYTHVCWDCGFTEDVKVTIERE